MSCNSNNNGGNPFAVKLRKTKPPVSPSLVMKKETIHSTTVAATPPAAATPPQHRSFSHPDGIFRSLLAWRCGPSLQSTWAAWVVLAVHQIMPWEVRRQLHQQQQQQNSLTQKLKLQLGNDVTPAVIVLALLSLSAIASPTAPTQNLLRK